MAPEYGFIPKNIRDHLDLSNRNFLSMQVREMISDGIAGAEELPVYIRALREEARFSTYMSTDPVLKSYARNSVSIFSLMLRDPDLQIALCESIAATCQGERFPGETVQEIERDNLAAERWLAIRDSIEVPDLPIGIVRLSTRRFRGGFS